MKNKKIVKRMHAVLLAVSLLIGIIAETDAFAAAAYVKLAQKSVTLNIREGETQTVYEATTIKVKASQGANVKKVTYASQNKKIAVVSAKGKVKARGEGNTKIIVTVKYKKYGKTQKKKLLFSVRVEEKDETGKAEDTDDLDDSEEAEDEEDSVMPVVTGRLPSVAVSAMSPAATSAVAPAVISVHTAAPVANSPSIVLPTAVPVCTEPPAKSPEVTQAPVVAKTTAKPEYATISNGTYKINSKVKSDMMLDVAGNATKNETNIQIYENNGTTAQWFNITHISSGWHKICSQSSGKALDVTGAVKKPGVNVQLYDYNGTDAQLWRFYTTDQGYYYIQNKLGYYLDVDGGKTANSTNVQVYSKNDTNAQKWKLSKIVFPQKVTLSMSSFTLTSIGATKKITVSFAPADTTQKDITWTSSNSKVATISGGTVKATGSGTATITAKTSNGKTASAKVTVNDGCVNVENGIYNIDTKVGSGFTLDVAGNATINGSNVQIYKKNGSLAQKFYVESAGNGWYVISNAYPKRCLDVSGASAKSRTNVQLYRYNGTDAQLWRFYSAGNGYYTVMNKLGTCLDVDGRSAKNGTNVQAYEKNNTDAQKWKLVKTEAPYVNIADSLYSLYSKVGNNFVLDISGNGTADGTNIQIYQGNDSTAQKFKIQLIGDGWYKISNPLTGKCLDVKDGSTKSGANVQLYTYNGTDAQKWRFYLSGDGEYFVIKNKLGYYLDVDGARAQNSTNVMVFTKNGTNAQKWKLQETSAIIVNPASFTLDGIGKTKSLSVSYEPADIFAANRTITWSSSNTKVATVSNGTVKAVGAGTATITAKAYNGKKFTVTVTVKAENKAQRIVDYELAQLGIGDTKGNNNVKYNTWYYGKAVVGSSYPWCMAFQAYCANQIGVLGTAVPRTASCATAVSWYKNRGQFKYAKYYGGSYTPKAGDLVFYYQGGSFCHVGMITAAPVNGYLQVVEGNVVCSDGNHKVVHFTKNSKRTVNNSYVYGYGTPAY